MKDKPTVAFYWCASCGGCEEAVVDHDCPLCQMMAEDTGPYFWHLDGCNMDDDFAFSFHRTRKEWEAERRHWDELHQKFEEEWKREQATLHSETSDPEQGARAPSVWKRAFMRGSWGTTFVSMIRVAWAKTFIAGGTCGCSARSA